MSSWIVPEATTRTGASHARRDVMCQDASGWRSLQGQSGEPVHLMVVADGHGGKRYIHSDVGSRLACELSLNLVTEQLGEWSSVGHGAAQRWQEWLEGAFPGALHRSWLAAVEGHWRREAQERETTDTSFAPEAYGTTIALVMMTPTWWGHTGLGDWDLVRIGSDGEVKLVNQEEEEDQTGGEATYSLCLSNAPRHFRARTAVHPITEQEPAFSLLLTTDGVRKSCSTDADFFAIARYLCEAEQPRQGDAADQLNADLDRISSQGSGDDVSVAIGRWAVLDEQLQRQGGNRRRGQQLQASQGQIVQPSKAESAQGNSGTRAVRQNLADPGRDSGNGPGTATDQGVKRRKRRFSPLLVGGLVALCAAAAGAIGMALLGLGPSASVDSGSEHPSPELADVLLKQTSRLCEPPSPSGQTPKSTEINPTRGDGVSPRDESSLDQARRDEPETTEEDSGAIDSEDQEGNESNDRLDPSLVDNIIDSLNRRRSTFQDLQRGIKSPKAFLDIPSKDPLGALIAWSKRHPSLQTLPITSTKKNGFLNHLSRMLPYWLRQDGAATPRASVVVFCPELREAFGLQWQREQAETVRQRHLDGETMPNGSIVTRFTTPDHGTPLSVRRSGTVDTQSDNPR